MAPYFVTHVEMKDPGEGNRDTIPLWLEIGVRNPYDDEEKWFTVQIRMSRKDYDGRIAPSSTPHVWLWTPDLPLYPRVYASQHDALDVLEAWLKGET